MFGLDMGEVLLGMFLIILALLVIGTVGARLRDDLVRLWNLHKRDRIDWR